MGVRNQSCVSQCGWSEASLPKLQGLERKQKGSIMYSCWCTPLLFQTCSIIVFHCIVCIGRVVKCGVAPPNIVSDKSQGLKKYDLCEQ